MNKPSLVQYIKDNFPLASNKTIDFSHYDVDAKNKDGNNALLLILSYCNSFNLKITAEQLDYLIYNSDLLAENNFQENVLTALNRYTFETRDIIKNEHWNHIVNTIYNPEAQKLFHHAIISRTTKSLMTRNSENESALLRKSEFLNVWHHLENKQWFINYLDKCNAIHNNHFQCITESEEIKTYKEKILLEQSTTKIESNTLFKI